jgi:hypothetical protein
MASGVPAHRVMLWSIVPGTLAFLAIAFLVVERPHERPDSARTVVASLAATPPAFRRYLGGILLFGSGDF